MTKFIKLTLLFSLLSILTSAQKQNNNWYFGNGSGITFSTGRTLPSDNGQLFTDEGSASISDDNGNLLFYTDGVTVWNKQHQIMAGGTALSGHKSSTQSAAIVPHPSKVNEYYIFTTTEKGGQSGLSYSIVDISKNSGKGYVVTKNKLLITPVSEKLTVTPHANQGDFWVISHKWNSDEFVCFLVNTDGITKSPVISKIGTVHKDVGSGNKGEAIGQIKVSPNGKKLACAITYKANQPIELYDFDSNTGKVSNLLEIPTSGFAYGVEFSPDNSKLYASFIKGTYGVIQYDLNETDIFENGTTPLSKPKGYENFGAVQRGPDNKIYVAKTGRYLDVITYPNKKGVDCGYKLGGINLRDRTCVYGLPGFVFPRNIQASIAAKEGKTNNNFTKPSVNDPMLNAKSPLCAENVELDAGVPNMVYLWSNGAKTQKITVNEPGTYTVKISKPSNISSETVSFNVTDGKPKVDLGPDTNLYCVANYELDAKNKGFQYKWSTGDKKQKIVVRESGEYSVTVTNGKCVDIDTINIKFNGTPPIFKALTSFSPKNNSFNSFFDYSITGVDEFELIVKNEKGKTIFKTTDKSIKWKGEKKNGDQADKGNYNWTVTYKGPCTRGEVVTKEGVVKLY